MGVLFLAARFSGLYRFLLCLTEFRGAPFVYRSEAGRDSTERRDWWLRPVRMSPLPVFKKSLATHLRRVAVCLCWPSFDSRVARTRSRLLWIFPRSITCFTSVISGYYWILPSLTGLSMVFTAINGIEPLTCLVSRGFTGFYQLSFHSPTPRLCSEGMERTTLKEHEG